MTKEDYVSKDIVPPRGSLVVGKGNTNNGGSFIRRGHWIFNTNIQMILAGERGYFIRKETVFEEPL